MASHFSVFPFVPGSHPVVARCRTEMEARAIEETLRTAGIACIRMDREAASFRERRVVQEAALILVNRADYDRALELLPAARVIPPPSSPAEAV